MEKIGHRHVNKKIKKKLRLTTKLGLAGDGRSGKNSSARGDGRQKVGTSLPLTENMMKIELKERKR